MRFRPITWALLSVMFFMVAALFMKLAREQRREHEALRQKQTISETPSPAPAPAPQSAAPAVRFPEHLVTAVTAKEAATFAKNEAIPYRVSNTTESADSLSRNNSAILLRNAVIDTSSATPIAIPAHLRAVGDPKSYIVQSRSVLTDAFRARLKEVNAQIISYIPNNAYLVRVDAEGAARLAKLPQTRSVLPFEPYYKLELPLLEFAVETKPLPAGQRLRVTLFPGETDSARTAVESLGARILGEDRSPFGPELIVQGGKGVVEAVIALAQSPMVQGIEEFHDRMPVNDLSRVRLGVAANTLSNTVNYLNLSGTNILVNINDTGVDVSHPDLTNRVIVGAGTLSTDTDGHGTHVAGTIASSGLNSPDGSRVPGSVANADYRGVAPGAQLLSLDFTSFFNARLQEVAAQSNYVALNRTNVLISNNSWGFPGVRGYNSSSASFDAAVRDALPELTGSQPVLYVFAAGNAGGGTDNGLGGFPGSVRSPANAKNVITVGALESPRNITNEVTRIEGTNVIRFPEFLASTDSSNQVAFFSSRGNVGIGIEGAFGRVQPDVVAPGSFIVSTRSQQWDTNFYYNPTNFLTSVITNLVIEPGETNFFSLFVPDDAVEFQIHASPHVISTNPIPPLLIFTNLAFDPRPSVNPNNFAATNSFILGDTQPGFTNGVMWFYDIVNTNNATINYDLRTVVLTTNDVGDFFDRLFDLNQLLTNYYRFESGSSMAAPAVSGMLALMQEFFATQASGGISNPSPALLKALLINSARSASSAYDLKVNNTVNIQGWGAPDLRRALPSSNLLTSPVLLFDQSPTNALGTDEMETRVVTLSPDAQDAPLRVTLVWTDPPGSPLAGVKLVNDLDLVVTNLVTGDVYFGNNFPGGGDFSDISLLADTNGTFTVINDARDTVNNVENVYINSPLDGQYAISVIGRRVNVNAVTAQTNGIKQDYALVISSGNTTLVSPITVSNSVITASVSAKVTTITNGIPLFGQRVGANSPLLISPHGETNQWTFYMLENTNAFTNVAFLTFAPPNLSGTARRGFQVPTLRNLEADIDLYVSTDPALTNLDAAVIASSLKSTNRGGTEMIVLTNASAGPFYVGIKSEDQRGAEFGFFGVASELPFSQQNPDGSVDVFFTPVPQWVPDGSPENPGGITAFGFSLFPIEPRRVVVTNTISHQQFGDLVGTLSFGEQFVVLNNHSGLNGEEGGTETVIYNDLNEGDTPYAQTTDGPGSLVDFIGEQSQGLWTFILQDNALSATGALSNFQIHLEPQATNDPNAFVTRDVLANQFIFDFVNVPANATNLIVDVQFVGGNPGDRVEVYLRKGRIPTRAPNGSDKSATFIQPGGSLSLSVNDLPPLSAGRYFLGLFNPGATTITVRYRIRLELDVNPASSRFFTVNTNTPLIDDALTRSTIFVNSTQTIASVQVGVRVDHPRVSDLSMHLVSPRGTRVLLFENRGGLAPTGLGATNAPSTNFVTVLTSNFDAATPGGYASPSTVDGWTVGPVGSVDVVNDPAVAHSGDQVLALNNSSLSRVLPTQIGRNYLLTFMSRCETPLPGTCTVNGQYVLDGGAPVPFTGTNAWVTNAVAFTAAANGTAFDFNSVDTGMLLDTITLQEIEVDPGIVYAVFTENTNLFPQMIKFATPPFGTNTAGTTNLAFVTNSFETALAGMYATGSVVEGWTVTSSNVSVLAEPAFAHSGTNVLALSAVSGTTNGTLGAVSRTLVTVPGRTYQMDLAYRRSPSSLIHWWPGNGNAQDVIGGQNGTLQNGAALTAAHVGQGFTFDGVDDYVSAGTSAGNFGTNDFAVDFWINTASARHEAIISKRPSCGAASMFDIRMGAPSLGAGILDLEAYSDGVGSDPLKISTTVPINDGAFHHIAFVRRATDVFAYVDGVLNATIATAGVTSISNAASLWMGRSDCIGVDTTQYFTGQLDEIGFHNRAISADEIRSIFLAGTVGRTDASYPPTNAPPAVAHVIVNGLTNVLTGVNAWTPFTTSFLAVNTNTVVTIAGVTNGFWVDSLQVAEVTGGQFYLPEESLRLLVGERAFGNWHLEIWDTRAGAAIGADLISWQLQFVFAGAAGLNVVPAPLPPGTSMGGVVRGNEIVYFTVQVPATATFATNILTSLGGNLDLLFNQNSAPTGGIGDTVLLAATTAGTAVLTTNGAPPLLPGQRYYLGVRNTNPAQTNNFILRVDFDQTDPAAPAVTALTNAIPLSATITNGNALQYYQFDVSTNALSVAFEILGANGNVDLYVRRGLPLPNTASYDYRSINPGTTDELVSVDENSLPMPLNPGTWYLGVFNATGVPVNYQVRATEVSANIIVLTNGVPLDFTANVGALTNFFQFVIDQTNSAALFELYNLSGNADLLLRRGAFPNTLAYDFSSENAPGPLYEQIVVRTNGFLPVLNGVWYLTVPNNEAVPVTFTIRGIVSANGLLVSGRPIQLVLIAVFPDGSLQFRWDTVVGEQYEVQSSTDLITWTPVQLITATGTVILYTTPAPAGSPVFYRVQQIPLP